jgi:hypothetical protein
MFSLTFSPKRAGAAHSISFGNSKARGSISVRFRKAVWLAFLCCLLYFAIAAVGESPKAAISKAAADRCDSKLKDLEDFSAHRQTGKRQTTRFSEVEVNSYLALDLRSHYHPCLKSLTVAFEENMLQGTAVVDFDQLRSPSSRMFPRLLSFMISGLHSITIRGRVVSGNGKARVQLLQARFDNKTLPRSLVEEIISAVGRKQTPPFDPLQSSELFDDIERLEVHTGYVLVYQ